jgi:hypothetical protein
MTNHQVSVTFNGSGFPLSINQPVIDLQNEDTVEWIFQSLPSGCMGYIVFNSPSCQPFGPFQALKNSVGVVTGIGNSGILGEYSYTALVLDPNDSIASSEGTVTRITNSSEVMNTVSNALGWAVYTPGDPPTIKVAPENLRAGGLQTIVWLIEDVPTDFFVTFRFEDFSDPLTGPFSSFLLSRSYGTTRLAVGTGFDAGLRIQGNLEGSIRYFVEVRDPQGTVVAFHDPVIEPLGSPPNPNP